MLASRFVSAILVCLAFLTVACQRQDSGNVPRLAKLDSPFEERELVLRQELVNDAPIGPGLPQPSDHCPTGPGTWFAGSGRSVATSNVFGDLTEVEVYCINVDRSELTGGIAT